MPHQSVTKIYLSTTKVATHIKILITGVRKPAKIQFIKVAKHIKIMLTRLRNQPKHHFKWSVSGGFLLVFYSAEHFEAQFSALAALWCTCRALNINSRKLLLDAYKQFKNQLNWILISESALSIESYPDVKTKNDILGKYSRLHDRACGEKKRKENGLQIQIPTLWFIRPHAMADVSPVWRMCLLLQSQLSSWVVKNNV